MPRQAIPVAKLAGRFHDLWASQWLLLTAGDFPSQRFNCMTVAWGSLGTMWSKPFAQVVVRPQRYTREFMDRYDTFTLCAFPRKYRKAMELLGTQSGRDGDKLAAAKLTPAAATTVGAPVYAEAELALECRKSYWQDLDPAHFLDPAIAGNYAQHDYHRVYFGELVAVTGTRAWRA